ncbi:hypothetical protein RRG08_064227 [Elysia crispata]|uniref:Uncharacterized protein n=1 Tax=Elysia crispata TaxID=231223 RepID=A0AAE0YEQ9_9GAST|nr:hypothetical protein RRG08_064227 [Elysia crispata]
MRFKGCMSQQLVENAPVRPKRKMFRLDEVQRLHVSTVGRETPQNALPPEPCGAQNKPGRPQLEKRTLKN